MVARNDKGNLLLIRTFKSEIDIVEVAEMEAILKALQVATSYGWNNVYESDALSAIEGLATKDMKSLHQKAEHVVNTIFHLISMFVNVSFVWSARETNRVAHLVGQWAKKLSFYGEVDINSLSSSLVMLLIQESDSGVAT